MIGESVLRLRPMTKRSPYSHGPDCAELEDWSNPSELVMDGVGIAPTSSIVKYIDIGSPIASGISLLFPSRVDLDITPRDRFRVRGDLWQVAGEPEVYISPHTGWNAGTVVKLVRAENA